MYMIGEDGTVQPLDYGNIFTIKVGEKFGWGDGDHFSYSIALKAIKDSVAYVVVEEKHTPPATHKYLAYNKSRECKICGR